MATYEWPELIALWRQGKLDKDQLIGQALQWGQKIHERATACHKRQATLERQGVLGQKKQAALEKQMAALLKRVEALEAQLSPKAKR